MSMGEMRNEEQNAKYLRATFGLMEDKNLEIKGLETQILQIAKLTGSFGQFIKSQIILDEVIDIIVTLIIGQSAGSTGYYEQQLIGRFDRSGSQHSIGITTEDH